MEMIRRRSPSLVLLPLFLALFAPGLAAQEVGERFAAPPPGNMQLVPGYEHWSIQGVDSAVGEIVKGDRVVIRYNIGPMAGERLGPKDRKHCRPYQEKRAHGQTARYCFSLYGLYVTFVETTANFTATPEDEAELINLLTMLESYRPDQALQDGREE